MTSLDTIPVERKALLAAKFREYSRTRVPQVAAEQVALEFGPGISPDEVIAWAERFCRGAV